MTARRAWLAAMATLAAPARGQPLAPTPRAPAISFAPRPGTPVPPGLAFTDERGRACRLADFLGTAPVILAPAWYRCPQLCGLLAQGLLEALHASGLPSSAARLVFVSIDPQDAPADAAARLRVDSDYWRFLAADAPAPAMAALVGAPATVRTLMDAIGYAWQPVTDAARLAHPAGAVVLAPDGRVSSLLPGVRIEGGEMRAALRAAADGTAPSPIDRLVLLCAHLDASSGAHDGIVLAGVRVAGGLTLAGLALLALRRRRTP